MKEKEIINKLRKQIFLTASTAPNAHIASAYSIVEILYTLYGKKIMNYDSKNPNYEKRDIFILSKGHGSLALYTILAHFGFFHEETLKTFAKPNSILGGEPCIPHIPGVECTTGSLGHGLSIGVGIALAKKIDELSEKVYVLLGDGECQEGTIWEALMFASHAKLNNLIIIVDCNKVQKMGFITEIMGIDNLKERFVSFGCNVVSVDGHDIEKLEACLKAENKTSKPKVILANTIKGKGVSIVENNPKWHWKLPNKKETKVFMDELNITEEEMEECKKLI